MKHLLATVGYLYLSYEEDVLPDPVIAYRKICAFLDLSPKTISPLLQRTNPFPLREIVTNYEEVCETLTGTPYAWMLEE